MNEPTLTAFAGSPLFGIAISLLTFQIGSMLYRRTGSVFLNPLVLSMVMIIAFLVNFQISFDDYNKGDSSYPSSWVLPP